MILTREQVEKLFQFSGMAELSHKILSHDAEQRERLAQVEQRVEALEKECIAYKNVADANGREAKRVELLYLAIQQQLATCEQLVWEEAARRVRTYSKGYAPGWLLHATKQDMARRILLDCALTMKEDHIMPTHWPQKKRWDVKVCFDHKLEDVMNRFAEDGYDIRFVFELNDTSDRMYRVVGEHRSR